MNKNKGFTLIEVMIAAIILFSAIALTGELFVNSSYITQRTAKSAQFYQIHPAAISAIKSSIRQLILTTKLPELSGNTLIMGIRYDWRAVRKEYLTRAITAEDTTTPSAKFGKYIVDVNASKKQKNESFSFEVTTW